MPPAAAISCYKCRSMDNSNPACLDPFSEQMKVEKRECPNYERCAKITGSSSNGQYFVIRDCFKTNYEPRSTAYREKRIQYYQDMLEGEISICKLNLCNAGRRFAVAPSFFVFIVLLIVVALFN